MSRKKRFSILSASIALGLGLIAILPQVATASFNGVHRSTVNGKERVVIPGQTPEASIEITTLNTRSRSLTLNNCGWGKFTESTTAPVASLVAGGSTLSIAPGVAPTCVKETTSTGAVFYSTNNTGPTGTVVKAANVIWVRGGTTIGAYAIDVNTNKISKAKSNKCGVASFTITATRPLTNFTHSGTNYTLASLPSTTNGGLICRNSSTGGAIAFAPLSGF
ncbi:hypothetical protein QUA70_19835 [Microcoleus sp. LAD1_D5]|uniref:hypothetical protein n=1 Tax=Microcoleus sp. LAD1_D5 TaxID=2818813 RepID=UPI002FD2B4F7